MRRRETLRYLGYGKAEPDEETKRLIEECEEELLKAAAVRWAMKESPLKISGERIEVGGFLTESRALSKNLSGCERALFMAVTLGPRVDRLLLRYGKLSAARAVVMQAAAAALIEEECDKLCARWKEEYRERGLFLRPRFSPGYGDFSLDCQRGILTFLEAEKRLGIVLTDGCLMIPSKSVTAVIGVGRTEEFCPVEGCEACEKKDCLYRRNV